MTEPGRGWFRWAHAESGGDVVFKLGTGAFAALLIVVFAVVVGNLLHRAWPSVEAFGLGFLVSDAWDPDGQRFGALPYVLGTVSTSLLALLLAVPVAVGTAVALTQLLPRFIATPLGFLVELLAAVPSIVFGIWGFAIIVPWVREIGGEQTFGPSVLAAGIVLAIMMLPIITAVSRDMLAAVPLHQRDAALALGATKWEVTRGVILPHASGGLVAAAILGLGRAVGETMAVIMVVGNQPILPTSVFDPASTMASVMANEFGDPSGPIHFASLVYLGLVLLLISLLLNLAARLIVRSFKRRARGTT